MSAAINHGPIEVRELAGWGFDAYPYRPSMDEQKVTCARDAVALRGRAECTNPILHALTAEHRGALQAHARRDDLLAETQGLEWSIAIVDLRQLLAFQRRLSMRPGDAPPRLPAPNDWAALICFAFPPCRVPCYTTRIEGTTTIIETDDPNLHLRSSSDGDVKLVAHTGSPFVEVARYRERWFLRDGYHRAYALLRGGVFAVPAIVFEAPTLADLGADQPQFFPEATLLGPTPPFVCDFLEPALTIEYSRPVLTRSICATINESFTPADFKTENGDA